MSSNSPIMHCNYNRHLHNGIIFLLPQLIQICIDKNKPGGANERKCARDPAGDEMMIH